MDGCAGNSDGGAAKPSGRDYRVYPRSMPFREIWRECAVLPVVMVKGLGKKGM